MGLATNLNLVIMLTRNPKPRVNMRGFFRRSAKCFELQSDQQESRRMISFCTPAKGRLHYLRQTYIHNLRAARQAAIPVEFVLLDYDCPDGMTDWARSNLCEFADILSLYKLTEHRPHYYIPVADNCAMKLASGEIVSNLMADVMVTAKYFREVYDLIVTDRNRLVRPTRQTPPSTTGLMTLWKQRFLAIGGYDEQLKGWGYQDVDFRHRCEAMKMELVYWTPTEAQAIPHGDELRVQFAAAKETPSESNVANIERSKRNVKKKRLVANEGKEWGIAPVERISF
jgi:hypothetical protein